jgi:hypothetical protein
MKIIITRVVFLSFLILTVPGCYTVVWEPDMEFPNENNSEYTTENYYDGGYYGSYDYFYNYPWWLSLNPPTKEGITKQRENSSTGTLRNSGDGRNPGNGRNPGGILTPPPPTRDGSTGNTTSNEGSNSGSSGETVKTDTNRSNNSGNSSNPVRNNDGNRTSDGKKR